MCLTVFSLSKAAYIEMDVLQQIDLAFGGTGSHNTSTEGGGFYDQRRMGILSVRPSSVHEEDGGYDTKRSAQTVGCAG